MAPASCRRRGPRPCPADNEAMAFSETGGEIRVEHVSDPALMVASARPAETARPGGVIRAPLPERLAGTRGGAAEQRLPCPDWWGIGVGLRGRTFVELLLGAVASDGLRTVIMLGAGLDTRPWRLDIPAGLHWIEVDF